MKDYTKFLAAVPDATARLEKALWRVANDLGPAFKKIHWFGVNSAEHVAERHAAYQSREPESVEA